MLGVSTAAAGAFLAMRHRDRRAARMAAVNAWNRAYHQLAQLDREAVNMWGMREVGYDDIVNMERWWEQHDRELQRPLYH